VTKLSEHLETPLETRAAFDFIADFVNSSVWDPGTATSERIDSGPVGVGARYQLGVRLGKRVAPMEYRITVFDPPNRVVLAGEGSGVSAVDDIRFAPLESGKGTRVDYSADIKLRGWMRLIQPLLGGAFSRLAKSAIGGMKSELDKRAS
jgi:carbon monoxide dehydrogenase subunit G